MNKEFFEELAQTLNRLPQKVTLVGITKSVGVKEMNEAIEAGVIAIGENRVESAEEKFPLLPPVEKHFIGRIQSRKIPRIVQLFDVIQSVGTIGHLKKIQMEALAQQKPIGVLLQFNISGETLKGGFVPDEFDEVVAVIPDSLSANSRELADRNETVPMTGYMQIIGVMGMAQDTKDMETVRAQFRQLKNIRDRLQAKHPSITDLSMGMSNDYRIALEEGATMLRIGRALFSG